VNEGIIRQETLARSAETLIEVSQELASWVPILRRLAEAEALRSLAFGHCFEISNGAVRSIITARRLRDQYFEASMTEAAWTVILELFANRLAGQPITVQRLSVATDIPLAATLHWIDWLAERGMASRDAASKDEASSLVELTDTATDQIRAYLLAALELSPWVQ